MLRHSEEEVIKRWGEWMLLAEEGGEELLEHQSGYRVDFREMHTTAGMLDIIFQVERKHGFISKEALGDFITALADIFDPQDTLCSDGVEHPFNPRAKLLDSLQRGFQRSRPI